MSTIYSQTIVTREAQPFRQSTLSRAIQFCLATSWKLKKIICKSHGSQGKARRWIQTFFIFNLTWGDDPIWLIFFKWVETTNQVRSNKKFHLKAGRISGCLLSFRAEKWTHSVLDIFFLFFLRCEKSSMNPWGDTDPLWKKHMFSIGWPKDHQLAFFKTRINPYTVYCTSRLVFRTHYPSRSTPLPFLNWPFGRLHVSNSRWRHMASSRHCDQWERPVTGLKHSTGWPPWYLERAC